jgi:hypothetical protein
MLLGLSMMSLRLDLLFLVLVNHVLLCISSTISSLEAYLKSPVVNACTSCDEVTLRNLELTSCLDVVGDSPRGPL